MHLNCFRSICIFLALSLSLLPTSAQLLRPPPRQLDIEALVADQSTTALDLSGTTFGDTTAPELAKLLKLRSLSLSYTRIDNDAIKCLLNLSQLEDLDLSGTKIDGTALAQISKLKTLRKLNLSATKVCGDNLRLLAFLPRLCSLDLSGTPIKDSDVQLLEGCQVQDLNIACSDVTEHIFECLGSFPNLVRLEIRGCGIGDIRKTWKNNFPDLTIDGMAVDSLFRWRRGRRQPNPKEQPAPGNSKQKIHRLSASISNEDYWMDRLERATLYTSLGRYQEAANEFELLIPSISATRDAARCGTMSAMFDYAIFRASNNCALCYLFLGDYNKSVAMASEAAKLELRSAIPRKNRGHAYLKLGLFSEALADLNRAIELEPNLASAYYYRAEAMNRLGRKQKAAADFATAKRLGYRDEHTRQMPIF